MCQKAALTEWAHESRRLPKTLKPADVEGFLLAQGATLVGAMTARPAGQVRNRCCQESLHTFLAKSMYLEVVPRYSLHNKVDRELASNLDGKALND